MVIFDYCYLILCLRLETDRYQFFETDTDIIKVAAWHVAAWGGCLTRRPQPVKFAISFQMLLLYVVLLQPYCVLIYIAWKI